MPFDNLKLGSGFLLPGIAFGTGSDWRANPRDKDDDGISREVVEAVKAAAAAGFRSFDAAEYYNTEKSLGQGLKESAIPREELFITSKIAKPESLADIPAAVKQQLAWLQVDFLDLYLIHTPKAIKDGLTFIGVWQELEKLVDQGLVRSLGVSNFLPEQFEQFINEARIKPAVNQISVYPYIYHRDLEVIEYSQKQGIAVEAYEVSSSLIRSTEKGGPLDPVIDSIVSKFASEGLAVTPGQVLLQWAAAKGFAIVTTSSKPSRIQEYVAAGEFRLEPSQVEAIDAAALEGAKTGFGQYSSWK